MSKKKRIIYMVIVILLIPTFFLPLLIDKTLNEPMEHSTEEMTYLEELSVFEFETETSEGILQAVSNLIPENLQNQTYDIYFKGSDIICIDVYYEGLADKVSAVILTSDYSNWNRIENTTIGIVNNIIELLKVMGHSEYSVCWTWCDTFEGEKTPFLICQDGEIIFDMVKVILTK